MTNIVKNEKYSWFSKFWSNAHFSPDFLNFVPGMKIREKIKKAFRYFLVGVCFFIVSTFSYVLYLRWFPPITTPLMLVRGMEGPYKKGGSFQYRCYWKNYSELPEQLKVAVIASEDQEFAFHHGIDYGAVWDAAKHNLSSNKVIGGSTISQQVAKNIFLWQGRTYLRKALEAYFTTVIELVWSKERIMEMYLNCIEMGDGIFGAEAASLVYFHHSSFRMTKQEAALLAAILPNPRKFSATHPSPYIWAKTQNIERFMRMIKGTEYLRNFEKQKDRIQKDDKSEK